MQILDEESLKQISSKNPNKSIKDGLVSSE
jgi:hypothetical protein